MLEIGLVPVLQGGVPVILPGGELAARKHCHVVLCDTQEFLQQRSRLVEPTSASVARHQPAARYGSWRKAMAMRFQAFISAAA